MVSDDFSWPGSSLFRNRPIVSNSNYTPSGSSRPNESCSPKKHVYVRRKEGNSSSITLISNKTVFHNLLNPRRYLYRDMWDAWQERHSEDVEIVFESDLWHVLQVLLGLWKSFVSLLAFCELFRSNSWIWRFLICLFNAYCLVCFTA